MKSFGMRSYPLVACILLKIFIQYFMSILKCYISFLLVENYCAHVENFIEHLKDIHDDDEFMDEELLEALHEKSFEHHKSKLEHSFPYTHNNLHQIIAYPLTENEVDQQLDGEIHPPYREIDKYLQLVCQLLCDQNTISEIVYVANFSQLQEDHMQEINHKEQFFLSLRCYGLFFCMEFS